MLLILNVQAVRAQNNFDEIFGADYQDAIEYLDENKAHIDDVIGNRNGDAEVLLPVVFPELVRYSIIRDQIETTGLKIFYVHTADEFPKFSNFSIGRFQMKPRFVEELEEAVVALGLLDRFADVVEFPTDEGKEIRRLRVQRLESAEWQAIYLSCFGAVMDARFSDGMWNSIDEKITFYATAYNHGFNASEDEISRWKDVALFPYGAGHAGRQYVYADVSLFSITRGEPNKKEPKLLETAVFIPNTTDQAHISNGADIDHGGPLVQALRYNRWDIAEYLLDHGADMTAYSPILAGTPDKPRNTSSDCRAGFENYGLFSPLSIAVYENYSRFPDAMQSAMEKGIKPAGKIAGGPYTAVAASDGYVYAIDNRGSKSIIDIIDVNNPGDEYIAGSMEITRRRAHSIVIEDGLLYARCAEGVEYDNGIAIIDVSDPAKPVEK